MFVAYRIELLLLSLHMQRLSSVYFINGIQNPGPRGVQERLLGEDRSYEALVVDVTIAMIAQKFVSKSRIATKMNVEKKIDVRSDLYTLKQFVYLLIRHFLSDLGEYVA